MTIRRNVARGIFLVLCFFLSSLSVFAFPEHRLVEDTVARTVREPSKEKQEKYYNDDYWNYHLNDSTAKEEPGVFDRIWKHFWQKLTGVHPDAPSGSGSFWNILFLLILITLVILAIVKLTNTGLGGFFSGKRKTTEDIDATLEDVDIHAIDYEKMIAEARATKDYRLAVRLWFLRTLKKLADAEVLHWKPEKTNSDYYYELSGSKLQEEFGKISFVYDYIWYGEFPVDATSYEEAEQKFRRFNETVKEKS